MSRLTNVECYHTGGGVFTYFAKFNDEVYLVGDLGECFGSYDAPIEEVEADLASDGPYQYEKHEKTPSVPYPTWNEILESIRMNCSPVAVSAAETAFSRMNMNEPCMNSSKPDVKAEEEYTEIVKTLTVTIRANPQEEMFSVELDGSDTSMMFGPTPSWHSWEESLKEEIGSRIVSIVNDVIIERFGEIG